MKITAAQLAKRYIKAFLNVYGQFISETDMPAFEQAAVFMKSHASILNFCKLTIVSDQEKKLFIKRLLEELSLPDCFLRLVDLLALQHRFFVLPEIFKQLPLLFRSKHHVMVCTITTSQEITPEQLSLISQFARKMTQCTIESIAKVDPRLIAGVRIQSDTFLWEYSIQKQLRNVQHTSTK